VSLGKALNGIASTFEWFDWWGWQLVPKTAKVTSLSPGQGTLKINEYLLQFSFKPAYLINFHNDEFGLGESGYMVIKRIY